MGTDKAQEPGAWDASHPSRSKTEILLQGALGTVILGLSFGSYLLVLRWRGSAAKLDTQMAWEAKYIPFWPTWLYVYLFPYALAPLLLGMLPRATFVWYIKRGLLIVGLSLAIFAIYPTKTVRPPVDDLGDGWTAQFYRDMVATDTPPANAAPSLHVSLTCLLALALFRDFPRWWLVTVLGVGLVWLATLLTWQHHLIDVAAGALLGLVVGFWGPKPIP
jgi:membrane-associated phospholipid phosphatase